MTKAAQLDFVLKNKLIAVVRSPDSSELVEVCRALVAGGVRLLEITFTVPNPLEVLWAVRQALGDQVIVGAGSVLDPETARAAILAGAEFVVGPTLNLDVIRLCRRYDKIVIPGAFTPTEILTAWEAGADIVKLFPAGVGGPAHLKAILAPLPRIRLMPTGGVDLATAGPFLRAGACCLGLGNALVDPAALAARDWPRLTALAQQFVAIAADQAP